MEKDHVAEATATIAAPADQIWDALVNPAKIKQYMFGTDVVSEWKEGSPISWKGEWKGKAYEDKGQILRLIPGRTLQYSHFSPLAGLPDTLENYHTVTIDLTPNGTHTKVTLTQDKNPTEEARQHSEKNWSTMLEGLKKLVEG
ncbi:MAG: SRPBCC family protein [Acidobacteriota bacterium]